MSAPHLAEMRDVCKRYGGIVGRGGLWALRGVSFELPAGCVLGILGPNRAGKTTLVKLLLSLCRASRGHVARLGRPVQDRSTLARVGYVHESQAFPRYLSARELLTYYGALAGVGRYTLARRVRELLERVGLADRAHEPIRRYSKGMLQRLALAQALVNDPALLVLDEPAEGMDLPARRLLHEVVRERRAMGHSVLLVSHSVADVEQLCDLALVLREGRVVFADRCEELIARSRRLPQRNGLASNPQGESMPQPRKPLAAYTSNGDAQPWAHSGSLTAALEQLYAETVP